MTSEWNLRQVLIEITHHYYAVLFVNVTTAGEWINKFFTITAEIHVRSLANFYGQYAERHVNLKFMRRISKRASLRNCNSTISYRKKQIDVSF